MKIEKLACCMARPMNAIRDLVAKVNEIITAHNEHTENHPSGGGGSESVHEIMVVTAQITGEENGGLKITPNKTFSEMWTALTSNQFLVLEIPNVFEDDDIVRLIPTIYYTGTIEFTLYVAGITLNAIITENISYCSLYLIIPE